MSRKWSWVMGAVPVLAVLAILALRFHGVRRDVGRWEAYQKASLASGEDLGITAWLPAPVAEPDDLMKHPWIEGFLASEDSAEAQAVAAMQASPGLGLDGYVPPSEGDSWFDGREAETAKVLETGRREAKHLEGIHNAIARSGCMVPVDIERPMETVAGPWTRIGDVSKALSLQADAALASGDGDGAVIYIEALLRLGGHFVAKNHLLSTVIGAGAEAQAVGLIDLGLGRDAFSASTRQRLLAALPKRDLPQQMAGMMRAERGMSLKAIGKMVTDPSTGTEKSIDEFFLPPERLVATNSLFFCETVDAALKPPLSRETWDNLDDILRAQEGQSDPRSHKIASSALKTFSSIGQAMMICEEEIDRVRRELAE